MFNTMIVLALIKLSNLILRIITKIHSVTICLAKLRNRVLYKAVNIKERER
jgi:hypothetical protein